MGSFFPIITPGLRHDATFSRATSLPFEVSSRSNLVRAALKKRRYESIRSLFSDTVAATVLFRTVSVPMSMCFSENLRVIVNVDAHITPPHGFDMRSPSVEGSAYIWPFHVGRSRDGRSLFVYAWVRPVNDAEIEHWHDKEFRDESSYVASIDIRGRHQPNEGTRTYELPSVSVINSFRT